MNPSTTFSSASTDARLATKKLTFSAVGFVALALTAISACSSSTDSAPSAKPQIPTGGACPTVGFKTCPGDVAADQATADGCTSSIDKPPCGEKYKAQLTCYYANSTRKDGRSDTAAAACAAQTQAFADCLSSSVSDAGSE